jgi:hypothetical protein
MRLLFLLFTIIYSQIYFAEYETDDKSCSNTVIRYYTVPKGCNAASPGNFIVNATCDSNGKYSYLICSSCTSGCTPRSVTVGTCESFFDNPLKSFCTQPTINSKYLLQYSYYATSTCTGNPINSFNQTKSGCLNGFESYECNGDQVTYTRKSGQGCTGPEIESKTVKIGVCQVINNKNTIFTACTTNGTVTSMISFLVLLLALFLLI